MPRFARVVQTVAAWIVRITVEQSREPLSQIRRRKTDHAARAGRSSQQRRLEEPLKIDGGVVTGAPQLDDGLPERRTTGFVASRLRTRPIVNHETPIDYRHEIQQ